jgi:hypothetical protein
MLRALSIGGLGAIFLAISPKLREQVNEALGFGVSTMEAYSPYSYAAGIIAILVTMVVSFNRGAQAR